MESKMGNQKAALERFVQEALNPPYSMLGNACCAARLSWRGLSIDHGFVSSIAIPRLFGIDFSPVALTRLHVQECSMMSMNTFAGEKSSTHVCFLNAIGLPSIGYWL